MNTSELKIGILLPRADMFPSLAMDFLNGLRSIIQVPECAFPMPKLYIESIGNAATEATIRIAEKLILQENIDLTISFCSFSRLEEMVRIFDSYRKPLIHLDMGGNIIKKAEHFSPHVIHHTLNAWQSAYASGVYAANKFGKKGAMISSYYDAGYHLSTGFFAGFTASGGEMVYNYVAPMDYKSETYEGMINGLEEANPDVIFSLFSFKESEKVMDVISRSDLNGKKPFITTGFMTDERVHSRNYQLEQVYSVASWSFDDENSSMQEFILSYKNTYNVSPNIMSLLGYETGQLVLKLVDETGNIPVNIGDVIQDKTINTPRGEIIFNDINESLAKEQKIRKFDFNQITYHNTVIDHIDLTDSKNLHKMFADLPYSGWLNPYICT